MEEVIAGLQGFTFTFEQDVELQRGTGLLPFQGMDSEWGQPGPPAQVLEELSSLTFPLSLLHSFTQDRETDFRASRVPWCPEAFHLLSPPELG